MGWYLRKAFSFGPFRINLSKGGLGYSFGVKGARIGTGPRGSYVHMGRGGIYYRQWLSWRPTTATTDYPTFSPNDGTAPAIDTARLTDSSADGLLREIQEKHGRIRLATPILIGLSLLLMVMLGFRAPVWGDSLAVAIMIGSFVYLRKVDTQRKTVSLQYHLEETSRQHYENLLRAFETLGRSHHIWQITSQDRANTKYNAGAETTVTREPTAVLRTPPPFIDTNFAVWKLHLRNQDLYFFPDRILVYQESQVGAVSYCDLHVTFWEERFTENSAPPADAKVVGQTWQYVNRSGGPDRRFASNPVLPVLLYGGVELRSSTGMNSALQVSNLEYGRLFAAALKTYAYHRSSVKDRSGGAQKSDNPGDSSCSAEGYQASAVGVGVTENSKGWKAYEIVKKAIERGQTPRVDVTGEIKLEPGEICHLVVRGCCYRFGHMTKMGKLFITNCLTCPRFLYQS